MIIINIKTEYKYWKFLYIFLSLFASLQLTINSYMYFPLDFFSMNIQKVIF